LEEWPARAGRFPVISGFRVTWDSRRPPGQRVLSVHLETELADSVATSISDDPSHDGLDEEVRRERGGRKYRVVTREYLAQGHDGYVALTDGKYLIDDESGQMMSTVVRKYLLGSRFVNRMARLVDFGTKRNAFIQSDTEAIIQREKTRQHKLESSARMRWKKAADLAIKHVRSKRHYQDNMAVARHEHMSGVDSFDGEKMRGGKSSGNADAMDEDLLVIHPIVDGRLKDVGGEA